MGRRGEVFDFSPCAVGELGDGGWAHPWLKGVAKGFARDAGANHDSAPVGHGGGLIAGHRLQGKT